MKLDDSTEFINGLWYGDGGTGKTTDLARMANLGPIVYINAESGLKKKPLDRLGVNTDNIRVWPDPSLGEAVTFDHLEALHVELLEELSSNKKNKIVGVCMDSVTEVYKKLLDVVVADAATRADLAGKQRDRFAIELRDYGNMTEQMRLLIRRFRDLPCHFAMAALQRREQDDDGQVTYQPAITPALQNDLIGWVDIVCATSVVLLAGEDVYRGLFRPHNKYRGKDRLGAMPKWLVNPGFDRVVAYANDDLVVEEDPIMIDAKEKETAAAAALAAAE